MIYILYFSRFWSKKWKVIFFCYSSNIFTSERISIPFPNPIDWFVNSSHVKWTIWYVKMCIWTHSVVSSRSLKCQYIKQWKKNCIFTSNYVADFEVCNVKRIDERLHDFVQKIFDRNWYFWQYFNFNVKAGQKWFENEFQPQKPRIN